MTRELTTIHTGIDFGEAPRWHDRRLWFSDFYRHGVYTLDADGTETLVVTVDQQPSGLGWMPDGTLLISSMLDRRVLAFGVDGRLREHADLSGIAGGKCNDMVVAANGTAYVGNFGFALDEGADFDFASLAGVRPDGSVFVAAEDLMFPNGSVITPDDKTLIAGETFGGQYTAWDVEPDGSLTNRRIWAKVQGHVPDGCCLDEDGAIWMSDVSNNRFCRVHEGGGISETIAVDANAVACVLGGDDGKTLFLLISPGTRPAELDGLGKSVIMTTRVEAGAAGRP